MGTMKTSTWFVLTLTTTLLAGGVLASPAAEARRPGLAGHPGIARVIEKLGLSEEQVGKIKAEVRAEKDTLVPLVTRLHQARKELRETIHQPGVTETAVRAAAAKAAVVEADFAVERAKLSGKISAILTPEQRAQAKEFEQKLDVFLDGAMDRIADRLSNGGGAR